MIITCQYTLQSVVTDVSITRPAICTQQSCVNMVRYCVQACRPLFLAALNQGLSSLICNLIDAVSMVRICQHMTEGAITQDVRQELQQVKTATAFTTDDYLNRQQPVSVQMRLFRVYRS